MIRIILIAWAVLSIPTAFGLYQLCRVSGQSSTSEPEEKRGNNDCPNPMRHRSPLHPR